MPVLPHTKKNIMSKCVIGSSRSVLCNTCLNPFSPHPTPLTAGSHRSEQHFSSLPGFYGHSQGPRGDVWGPSRHWRISFLFIFNQLYFFLLHACGSKARGGPQGEAGGP